MSVVASAGTRMMPMLFSILIFVPNGSEIFWILYKMARAFSGDGVCGMFSLDHGLCPRPISTG